MNYLFGPVQSRRLGVSLGIDLVPYKTCSMDCVYCECGCTSDLTVEVREYVPTAAVIAELDSYLSGKPSLDAITFSGGGEPTLHGGIGEVIRFIRGSYPEYKTVVLTNGSLFWRKEVRDAVRDADIIVPSLDAAREESFRRITRTHGDITLERVIGGLASLREEFSGLLYLEIFIVPGMNDSDEEVLALREACGRIRPDLIQLNTLDRPGTESSIRPADSRTLERVRDLLRPFPSAIAGKPAYGKMVVPLGGDIENGIRSLLARRPSTAEDLSRSLCAPLPDLLAILARLEDGGIVSSRELARGKFYRLK